MRAVCIESSPISFVEVSLVSRSLPFPSCVAVISVLCAVRAGAADAPPAPADPYAALEYRFIGPPGNGALPEERDLTAVTGPHRVRRGA
jgi:hypothetical protein